MADSAAKRRKTSPTTSIPIDAPTTPSRIPAPRKDGPQSASRRPSFASPTKASLSRHNPQLLNRPASSGGPGNRGKDLQDVFAKALGEQPSMTGGNTMIAGDDRDATKSMSTTQENDPSAYDSLAKTPPRARSKGPVGGGLATKPRRLSKSPMKRPEWPPVENPIADALPDDFNPFQKKGLRRSPISSSADAPAPVVQDPVVEDSFNPFKKTGLRRSPISSQPEVELRRSPILSQPLETAFRVSPTAPELPVAALESIPEPFSPTKKLRRSPVISGLVKSTLEQLPEAFSPTKKLRRSPVFTEPVRSGLRRSPIPPQAASETIEPPNNTRAEEPESELPPVQAEPAPVSRMLFAEIPREHDISRPHIPPPEARQQAAVTPTEPISQPKMLFAEISRKPKEQTIVPDVVQDSATSTTPMEPRPRRSSIPKIPVEPQKDSPVAIPESGQRTGPSKMDEVVQDLFTGNRRAEEPDLPPTPTQLGIPDPVVTTPPTGIHDTPSKRARRNKALGAKLKSSPLKPRDPPPQEPPEPVPQPELKPEKPEKPRRRKSARFLIPEDPHAAKKKERDDLLKQLQQLQADVALANQENERLRIRSESRKKGLSAAPNPDELRSMLSRSTAPELSSEPAPKPSSIFQSVRSFLPFAGRRRRTVATISEKPLPSHLPIALNDPLPYLQAFSPLTYSSTITILPSEAVSSDSSLLDEQPILQRHVITASHPSGLFSTRLSMTVNTSALTIASLDILRLDMNAEKELGTFIRARSRSEHPLGKDITIVCWAMSRWIEVSIQRAQFWCAIEKDFGTPQARAKTMQKKRKRKRQVLVQDDETSGTNGKDVHENEEKHVWTRRQLLSQIGRTSLELANEHVELRFEWRISFDWTGEAETTISANARLPRTWQQADDRGSLAKVPETFNKLVKERGHLDAVRATVGLFMPAS
ncbi:hypothetical protein BKA61DRAFT_134354 [Leptodontidium sp. MPI-SDFR-AT-0119]|nr:hypothetical protein BKA61DRAFT_134354 [Leptodontidium sp. MPI-SDFR-AT-0119]